MEAEAIISPSLHAQGFHFSIDTKLQYKQLEHCHLQLTYSISPDIIVDPYELQQLGFSFNLSSPLDLELPVDIGTSDVALLHLDVPQRVDFVALPLHMRYGKTAPSLSHRYRHISIPIPRGEWVCAVPGKPHPSYEYFPMTALDIDSEWTSARIPVGLKGHLSQVQIGTPAVMISMFVFLLFVFQRTISRVHDSRRK